MIMEKSKGIPVLNAGILFIKRKLLYNIGNRGEILKGEKMKQKIRAVLVMVCLGIFCAAVPVSAAKKPYIKVCSGTKVAVARGCRLKIKAKTVRKHRKIYYKSSRKSVATVTSKGTIKAKKCGKVTIYVKAKGMKTKKIKVYVKKPVTGITCHEKHLEMKVGQKRQIRAYSYPCKSVVTAKLYYISSDENVLQVSSTGQITAVGGGKAKITVGTYARAGVDGKSFRKTFDVRVKGPVKASYEDGKTIYKVDPAVKNIRISFVGKDKKVYSCQSPALREIFAKVGTAEKEASEIEFCNGLKVSWYPATPHCVYFKITATGEEFIMDVNKQSHCYILQGDVRSQVRMDVHS